MGGIPLLLLTAVLALSYPPSEGVQKLYSWDSFEFADLPHNSNTKVGGYKYYNSTNITPTSFGYDTSKKCLYMGIPRRAPGVPATIVFLSTKDSHYKESPRLRAFPTYEDNYLPGWFGVNDLKEGDDEVNIYPDPYKVKRDISDEDYDEVREEWPIPSYHPFGHHKPSIMSYTHYNPSHGSHYAHGHHSGSHIIYYPRSSTTRSPVKTTPRPTYKPAYETTYNPPYKQTYKPRPPATTTLRPTYKPSYPSYKPPYHPSYKPAKPHRNSYHFVSIYAAYTVEQCSRLFFLDVGSLQYPEGYIVIRKPVFWAFDIYGCDQRSLDQPPVLKLTIPDSISNDAAGLYDFTVDVYGSCNQFTVYIVNSRDNKLIVYDNEKRSFWYFKHKTFYPGAAEPHLYDFVPIPPNPFNWGILPLTLGGKDRKTYRDVFYAPGSSLGVFKTNTEILRNQSLAPSDPSFPNFAYIGYAGSDSIIVMLYDEATQIIFFIHLLTNTLNCWNTKTHLVEENVATLFSDLTFGVDLYIDQDRNLWFMMANVDIDYSDPTNTIISGYLYSL